MAGVVIHSLFLLLILIIAASVNAVGAHTAHNLSDQTGVIRLPENDVTDLPSGSDQSQTNAVYLRSEPPSDHKQKTSRDAITWHEGGNAQLSRDPGSQVIGGYTKIDSSAEGFDDEIRNEAINIPDDKQRSIRNAGFGQNAKKWTGRPLLHSILGKRAYSGYGGYSAYRGPLLHQLTGKRSYSAPIPEQTYSKRNYNAPLLHQLFGKKSYDAPMLHQMYGKKSYEAPMLHQMYGKKSYDAPMLHQMYGKRSFDALLHQIYGKKTYDTPILHQLYGKRSIDGPLLHQMFGKKSVDETVMSLSDDKISYDGPALPQIDGKKSYESPLLHRIYGKRLFDGPIVHQIYGKKSLGGGPLLHQLFGKRSYDGPLLHQMFGKRAGDIISNEMHDGSHTGDKAAAPQLDTRSVNEGVLRGAEWLNLDKQTDSDVFSDVDEA